MEIFVGSGGSQRLSRVVMAKVSLHELCDCHLDSSKRSEGGFEVTSWIRLLPSHWHHHIRVTIFGRKHRGLRIATHVDRERLFKIEGLEDKIKKYLSFPNHQDTPLELDLELEDSGDDEDTDAAMQVGGKFKYNLEHLELNDGKNWLQDLRKDKDQLSLLCSTAQSVTPDRDEKLAELKKLIEAKVRKPTTNKLGEPNKKVLVFTAFADTATYLYESLLKWGTKHLEIEMALVCGLQSE